MIEEVDLDVAPHSATVEDAESPLAPVLMSTAGQSPRCDIKARDDAGRMRVATCLIGLSLLLTMSITRYNSGIVRTVERRFELRSVSSSILMVIEDVMQCVTSGFLAYLGTKNNKMRILAFTLLLTTLGLLINSLPFFIFGPMSVEASSSEDRFSLMNVSVRTGRELCEGGQEGAGDTCHTKPGEAISSYSNRVSYMIIVAGNIVGGLSSTPIWYLGIPYIEENVNNDDTTLYVGFVSSMILGSKSVGVLLASLTLSLPEALHGGVSRSDTRFIGAWWLGYVLLGVALLLTALPMFSQPKHSKHYYNHVKTKKQRATKSDQPGRWAVLAHIKEFCKAVCRLMMNKDYVLLILTKATSLYGAVGVMIQLPRFLEIHYHQSANIANLITACIGAVAGIVGVVAGSCILRRLGSTTEAMMRMFLVSLSCAFFTIFIATFIPCEESKLFPGLETIAISGSNTSCWSYCDCRQDVFHPVCDGSGLLYTTPCHAGCTSKHNQTFTNCSCVVGGGVSQAACASTCLSLIPFILLIFISTFLTATGVVPALLLTFRLVDQEDKTLAMSIRTFFINFGTFVCGHLLFGWLIDASCLVWKQDCLTTGSCMIYDNARFRYYTYGVTTVFSFLAIVLALILFISLKKSDFKRKKGNMSSAGPPQ